jgi:23S rRNA (cytosine1962-C5)-methyltransferase
MVFCAERFPIPKSRSHEHNLKFNVDIAHGHKTGFYLDQRENRHRAGELSKDRDVLNCFCYTGGFSITPWPRREVCDFD